jgi:protein-tyrosine phosphatase
MISEAEIEVIVMLTNCVEFGKTKCEQYWPADPGQTLPLPDIGMHVDFVSEEVFPDFVMRTLTYRHNDNDLPKVVTQYHFVTWPDHGVPETTLGAMQMLQMARHTRTRTEGPMLVHCSAGVGRTGVIIAIDINLDMMVSKHAVDVQGTLNMMRRQRTTMVQTDAQYAFIYASLLGELTSPTIQPSDGANGANGLDAMLDEGGDAEMNAALAALSKLDKPVGHSHEPHAADTFDQNTLELKHKRSMVMETTFNGDDDADAEFFAVPDEVKEGAVMETSFNIASSPSSETDGVVAGIEVMNDTLMVLDALQGVDHLDDMAEESKTLPSDASEQATILHGARFSAVNYTRGCHWIPHKFA